MGDTSKHEDWPAWRGGQQHGAVASNAGPVSWAGLDDARWVTTIPGRGNSSPIVASGRVYVTTAFQSRETEQWNEAWSTLRHILVFATLLLYALSFFDVRDNTSESRIADLLVQIALATLLLLMGGLELFGDSLLDFERCVIRRWLGSSLTVTLCAAIACHRLQPTSSFILWVGLATIVFGAVVILGVPSRDHAFRGGLLANNGCIVLTLGLLPMILGLGYTSSYVVERLGKHTRRRKWLVNLTLASLLFAWLLKVIGVLVKDQQLKMGLAQPAFGLWILGVPFALVLCAFFMLWFAPVEPISDLRSKKIASVRGFLSTTLGVATGIVIGYFAIRLAIQWSPFLAYHLSNVRFGWQVSWFSLSSWIVCLLPLLAVGILRWRAPMAIRPAGRWCALVLALVVFAERNYLTAHHLLSRAIIAVNAESGETLWTTTVFRSPREPMHRDNSPATPTPVVWKSQVYAVFASGIACVSADGKPIWTNRELTFRSVYGIGASPAVDDGILVVSNLMPTQGYVAALSCENGEVLWRHDMNDVPRNAPGCSRSPQIIELNGLKTVLIWGYDGITGLSLASGKQLWSWPIDGDRGDMVSNVVIDDQQLYCSAHGGLTVFDKSQLAGCDAPEMWRTRSRGPNVSSPVVCNGLLFFVTDQGIASCIDAYSGEKCWRTRLKGEHFASLVALGDYIYFCNRNGETTVVRASRQFDQVSTNHLGIETLASYAMLKDGFVIRAGEKLIRIDNRLAK